MACVGSAHLMHCFCLSFSSSSLSVTSTTASTTANYAGCSFLQAGNNRRQRSLSNRFVIFSTQVGLKDTLHRPSTLGRIRTGGPGKNNEVLTDCLLPSHFCPFISEGLVLLGLATCVRITDWHTESCLVALLSTVTIGIDISVCLRLSILTRTCFLRLLTSNMLLPFDSTTEQNVRLEQEKPCRCFTFLFTLHVIFGQSPVGDRVLLCFHCLPFPLCMPFRHVDIRITN